MSNPRKRVSDLLTEFKNPYNDALKRAAFDVAVTHEMILELENVNDAAKDEIRKVYAEAASGTKEPVLADKGIAVGVHVKAGASRVKHKLIPGAVLNRGWKNEDGKPLTLKEITDMIDDCRKEDAPSITITSSISPDYTG